MFADEFRPKNLDEVIGNEHIKASLKKYFDSGEIPHTLQFHGQFGAGKTTLARIVASQLKADVTEHDCGANGEINKIRSIVEQSEYSALFSDNKVIILDEVHKLSKEAQNVLLKSAEEPSPHTYFILCTSEPEKLIPALRSRGVSFTVEPVGVDGVREAYRRVMRKAKINLEGKAEDWDKVVESAAGSLRNVYNTLDKMFAAGEKDDTGGLYISTALLDKLLGRVDEDYTMDETMPLPQAVIKKDLTAALEAIAAAKKEKREPMPTLIGLYNYLKKARLLQKKTFLADAAEILSQPEKANSWYSLEYLVLKHL